MSMDERPCDLCLTVKPEVVGTIQCQNMQASSSLAEMKGMNKEQRESLAFLDERLKTLANQLIAGFMGSSDIRVAVLPIENASGAISGPFGNYLTERLTNNLYSKSVVKVVERAQLKKVIDELALTQGGNFDEGSAKKIGRFLGVDAVVTGTYAELGNQTVEVNARVVSVETGEVLGVGTVQIPKAAIQQMLR
jgi:TolB-like protein